MPRRIASLTIARELAPQSKMPHIIEKQPTPIKIAVLGAAGGIGQSLSLLLKTQLQPGASAHVHLALYDVNADGVNGVAVDLSHVDTPVTVSAHAPQTGGLMECLAGADLVLIPAGVPRKPGMTRDDLFAINAKIVTGLADAVAQHCDLRRVFVIVISNPVNSLVPAFVERLALRAPGGSADPARRVLGATNLDVVRASTFLHELAIAAHYKPRDNEMPRVPVVGGHSGDTILPLFSLADQKFPLTAEQQSQLVHRVQYGGDEVVQAKNGAGSATLSMAHAAFRCAQGFVALLSGATERYEGTYYVSLLDRDSQPVGPGAAKLLALVDRCDYFAVPVSVTAEGGVQDVDYKVVAAMSEYERTTMLPLCLSKLKNGIQAGRDAGKV